MQILYSLVSTGHKRHRTSTEIQQDLNENSSLFYFDNQRYVITNFVFRVSIDTGGVTPSQNRSLSLQPSYAFM